MGVPAYDEAGQFSPPSSDYRSRRRVSRFDRCGSLAPDADGLGLPFNPPLVRQAINRQQLYKSKVIWTRNLYPGEIIS